MPARPRPYWEIPAKSASEARGGIQSLADSPRASSDLSDGFSRPWPPQAYISSLVFMMRTAILRHGLNSESFLDFIEELDIRKIWMRLRFVLKRRSMGGLQDLEG